MKLRSIVFGMMVSHLISCGLESTDERQRLLTEGSGTEITGTWETKCKPSSVPSDTTFGNGDMTFGTTGFLLIGDGMDETCAVTQATYKIYGTYALPTRSRGPKNIDIKYVEWTTTPRTQSYAAMLNAIGFCDHSDWKVNEAFLCTTFTPTIYQLYERVGDKLYFGDTSGEENGSSPETRPNRIDTTLGYSKK